MEANSNFIAKSVFYWKNSAKKAGKLLGIIAFRLVENGE
jgi:hypothetical protein